MQKTNGVMMVGGISFDPPVDEIMEIISKKMGVVAAVARFYNVSRWAVEDYMHRHPEVYGHLQKVRHQTNERILDESEVALLDALTQKDNRRIKLDAAKYVLENKGKARGWGKDDKGEDYQKKYKQKLDEEISQLYDKIEQFPREAL